MTGQPVASVRFRSMSEDVDLEIHGQPIKLKSSSLGSTSSHEFYSGAVGGTKFKWKKAGNSLKAMEVHCLDPSGKVVASFQASKKNKVLLNALSRCLFSLTLQGC